MLKLHLQTVVMASGLLLLGACGGTAAAEADGRCKQETIDHWNHISTLQVNLAYVSSSAEACQQARALRNDAQGFVDKYGESMSCRASRGGVETTMESSEIKSLIEKCDKVLAQPECAGY